MSVLGEVALEQGDLAAARGWSDRAWKTLAGWPDAGIYGRRAKQLADALDRRVMAEPVTPAERRVLELLPTHLTTAHLAERLFLSQNTVKAHLRSNSTASWAPALGRRPSRLAPANSVSSGAEAGDARRALARAINPNRTMSPRRWPPRLLREPPPPRPSAERDEGPAQTGGLR